MDGAIDLGAVRRARVELDAITRQDPSLMGERGTENIEGWNETMVREIERICHGCGIPFTAKRKDQTFHDTACRAQHWRDAKASIAAPSPLETAMDLALSLYRAQPTSTPTRDALRALRALLLAELAEHEPSTPEPLIAAPLPLDPEPLHAPAQPAIVTPEPEPIAAVATPEPSTPASSSTCAAKNPAQQPLLDRTLRALNTTTKAAISKALNVDRSTLVKFVSGQRALGEQLAEHLDRWLDSHERSLKTS